MKGLTKKQRELLILIEKMKLEGQDPYVARLARDLGLAQTTVRARVMELQTKGYIKYIPPLQNMTKYYGSKRIVVVKPLIMDKLEKLIPLGVGIELEDIF